jgi:hypothetical protein
MSKCRRFRAGRVSAARIAGLASFRSPLLALSILAAISGLAPGMRTVHASGNRHSCWERDVCSGQRVLGRYLGEKAAATHPAAAAAPRDDWPATMILGSYRTYADPSAR